ncbi:hypothetical protein [Terriglobus roseus]|uniref:Uncharacterized protein n=1 Tax=Terriglobus roseus TaxID=392734 RepID=A0A1H4MLU9_9BACT|nr:hypothetical protein [Terriglobus roseus]SEB83688.1 hypothetical protein SAMN05443244_1965 [Terriglobus roseus]
MDPELSLNAWILIGNTLHAVLRGPAQLALADGSLRNRLATLDAKLAPVTQQGMLGALHDLPPADRLLLHDLCEACFGRLQGEAETLLGLDRSTAEPVLALLQVH